MNPMPSDSLIPNLSFSKTNSISIPEIPSPYMANFDFPRPQNFSLPKPIIQYVMNNKTKGFYSKIVRTCKYFYSANRIFVLPTLSHIKSDVWALCMNPDCPGRCGFKLFNIRARIWNTKVLCIQDKPNVSPNTASSLIPKLYRCDIKELILNKQILSFKEFLFLTKNIDYLVFHNGIVYDNDNETIIPLEKIVESLPKLTQLYYSSNDQATDITLNTVKNLLKLNHLKNLKVFDFCYVPEVFDFKTFSSEFMDKNKRIKFHLCFRPSISEAFKFMIEAYKDGIKNETFEGINPPDIVFL